MTGTSRNRRAEVDELLADAMELPPAQRRNFLEQNAPDPEILAETLGLIKHGPRLDEEDIARDRIGPATGDKIGPYSVRWLLGQGTFGDVYLAFREDVGQRVALKLLKSSVDPEIQDRFEQEARVLASLDHPNITRLVDFGRTRDGHLYLVMDLADGGNLSNWVKRNKPGRNELLRLFVKVCDAVQHAHSNLILHRDIKPSNILMSARGEPKLVDFGLVQMLGSLASVAGSPLGLESGGGSPGYGSPEQFRDPPLSTASDVFSLGVVLKEVLGDSSSGYAQDDDVGWIVRRCLQENPKARYANAGELRDDVEAYLAHRPLKAGPNHWTQLARLFALRHRRAVAVSAVGLALLLGAMVWIWRQNVELKLDKITLQAKVENDRKGIELLDAAELTKGTKIFPCNSDKRALQGAPTVLSDYYIAVLRADLAQDLLQSDKEGDRREGWTELDRAHKALGKIRDNNRDCPGLQREIDRIEEKQKELKAGLWTGSGNMGFAKQLTPPKLSGPGLQAIQAFQDARSARALGDVWRSLGKLEKASAAYERAVQLSGRAAADGVPDAVKVHDEAVTERDEAIRLTENLHKNGQPLPK